MSVCLKRFPLISFSRYSAPAVVARSLKTVASDSEPSEHAKVKKRRTKKVSEPKPPPPPNILEWNSIKEHLKELSDTNGKLVIADIERCRPRSHAAPGSNEYEKEYNDLLEKITKSFTGKQLRQFLELYELPLPSARGRKEPYATTIIEQQWNWPSLSAIREQQRETETDVEIFPLTPSQAFLMLGKDGADARTLSIKYRVRMAYLADPLSLRVEGMVGSLKKLAKHVADLKAAMVEEVFELPVDKPISRDLLHRISRLSGAFTENFGQRKVRVSFNKSSPRTAVVAKRLAARAACEASA
ncbi:hypothetical protein C8R44DRAFT_634657 [Mycena epipterygia]|nr:hypothetical protein C8R44DRAFT_634657 [Mycena epipterygia]